MPSSSVLSWGSRARSEGTTDSQVCGDSRRVVSCDESLRFRLDSVQTSRLRPDCGQETGFCWFTCGARLDGTSSVQSVLRKVDGPAVAPTGARNEVTKS